MKRFLVLLVFLLGALPALGASYWTLNLDDQPVPAEMPPVPVGDGAFLVSARSLCQALKATYDYDGANGQIRISRSGTVVELTEGAPTARINGREVRMPVPARRESGIMTIPVPFIAQVLGFRSQVNAQTMTVSLTSGGTPSVSPPVASSAQPTQGATSQTTAESITGLVSPANASAAQKSMPSALPWLASGGIPGAAPFPASVGLPTAAVPVLPSTGATMTSPGAVPTLPYTTSASPYTSATTPPSPYTTAGAADAGAVQPPSPYATATSPYTTAAQPPSPYATSATPYATANMPAVESGQRPSSGTTAGYVQLPSDAYQTNYRVDPGTRARSTGSTFVPYNMSNEVTTKGGMDFVPAEADVIAMAQNAEQEPRPDPAITGLTLERRYDQFVTSYTVRYRITNLGQLPTDRPLMLRLLVGGKGDLQIMQDIKIDRLDSLQSLSFEWFGDARSFPALHDLAVRAQAKVMLDDQALDRNTQNNARSIRLSY